MPMNEKSFSIDDRVKVVSDHAIFDDLRGQEGNITSTAGPDNDPTFTVRFDNGDTMPGLRLEDIDLIESANWV